MSTRALGWTAALLLLLLGGITLLALHRWGLLAPAERPQFVFTNPLLTAPAGQRLILRHPEAEAPDFRYTFAHPVFEPEPEDPHSVMPHIRVGLEDRRPGEEHFSFRGVGYLDYAQMGALTPQEWIEEIGLVREQTRDGQWRTVLRATFGHVSAVTVAYYIDPAAPVPGLGWYRQEIYGEGKPQQLLFAADGGRVDLGERRAN